MQEIRRLQTETEIDAAAEYCRALADIADDHQAAMRGMNPKQAEDYMRVVIEEATVAWDIFPDAGSVEGFGAFVITGRNVRAASVAEGITVDEGYLVALRFDDLEHVLEASKAWGDDRPTH